MSDCKNTEPSWVKALEKARAAPRKKTPSLRKAIDAKCKEWHLR